MKANKFISIPIEASNKSSQYEDDELNKILDLSEPSYISQTIIATSDISHIIGGEDNTSTIYLKSNTDTFINTLLTTQQILSLIYSPIPPTECFIQTMENLDLPLDNQ
jgi:predicted class III extradiol MEMO1 family dioxygenase